MTTAKNLHEKADGLSNKRMAATTQRDELLLSIEENEAYAAYYNAAAVEATDADDINTCRDTAKWYGEETTILRAKAAKLGWL